MRNSILLLAIVAAISLGREPGFAERWALMDSLRGVPPKQREWWLRKRGIEFPCYTAGEMSDSGLRLVGKWGRGPAVAVTGEDTLVVLTLGSEVALFGFADPDHPHLLSEIQFNSLTRQSQLAGALLYVSSGRSFEVWDVTEPRNPVRRGSLPFGISDFRVNDSFLYYIKADTFKVFSVANPAAMYQLGACRDSGCFLCAGGGTAVLKHGYPDYGLYFLDITDPRNPRRAGCFATDLPRSAEVRGNLCCATVMSRVEPYPIRFLTLDISNPSSPRQLGSLRDAGGEDIFLDGPLVFATGKPFHIISIADSAHPSRVGQLHLTGSYNNGVWADWTSDRAYVANEADGLTVVDISDLGNPQRDTSMLGAGYAVDIEVRGQRCYVADLAGGLKILDVSDPTQPTMLGELDTVGCVQGCYSVAVDDSFAYCSWSYPYFRVADVRDPARPEFVGYCEPLWCADDMVLRDTLVYCACSYRFEVINVARPREPVVVGTLRLPWDSWELILADTLAYIGNFAGVLVVSVARPDSPRLVGEWPHLVVCGIDLKDTVLYAVGHPDEADFVVLSLSVANPAAPYLLDSLVMPRCAMDILVVDTIAYCAGGEIFLVSVADPRNLRLLPGGVPPWYEVGKLTYCPPYLYASCFWAGICILEMLPTGVAESGVERLPAAVSVAPTVTAGRVHCGGRPGTRARVDVTDIAGRSRLDARLTLPADIDLSDMPGGVYYVRVRGERTEVKKVVKTERR